MKTFLFTLFFIIPLFIWSQTPIDIAETTIKLDGWNGEQIFYYGFAQGDKLVFNFEELDGKKLTEIEISELPSSSRFTDYKTSKIENQIITVPQTAVYKFRFSNTAMGGRVCKIKIQRIPAKPSTVSFNSNVLWRTVNDTSYKTEQEKVLRKDTSFQEVYSSTIQISSKYALNGNKNFQIVDFTLPENTHAWGFYIGIGEKGKQEFVKANDNFIQSIAKVISHITDYGPLAALALTGVSYFNKVQGDDNVKYWFMKDTMNVRLFNTDQKFTYYKMGDVVTEASQMKSPLKGKIYLALMNDNKVYPIQVTIKATAVLIKDVWTVRTVRKMISTKERQEAYLKN